MSNNLNRRDFIKGAAAIGLGMGTMNLRKVSAEENNGVQVKEQFVPAEEFVSSFVVSKEDVKNFVNLPRVDRQEGIGYAYEMSEEIVRKILPPPLEYVSNVIGGYLVEIKEPNFGGPYMETCNWVPAMYGDTYGYYNISLMLCGPGADCGLIVGDQCCGIPKKIADEIVVRRQADRAYGRIVRHGEVLFEIEVKIDGEYNDPEAGAYNMGNPKPGDTGSTYSWYHKYDVLQTENGNTEFSNLRLLGEWYTTVKQSYEAGKIVSLKVKSTPDDPYGELAMVRPIGASWYADAEAIMEYTKVFATLDTEEVMPYLMSNRFDRSMMGYHARYFNL